MESVHEAPPDPQTALRGWNYSHLLVSWVVGILLQLPVLPCLCAIGDWRMEVALWFDLMILLRIIAAFLMKQTGTAWIFYTVLCYTSAFWLYALTDAILFFSGNAH